MAYPFTVEQFYGVFRDYRAAVRPAQRLPAARWTEPVRIPARLINSGGYVAKSPWFPTALLPRQPGDPISIA